MKFMIHQIKGKDTPEKSGVDGFTQSLAEQ
jgi:hypothetical protein